MFLTSKMPIITPGFRPIYEYQGTDASDYLSGSNIKPYWTNFVMGGGDDVVISPSTGKSYYFDGGSGLDTFLGDSAVDVAHGGDDNDTLWGFGGNDRLYGDNGADTLVGGADSDTLVGDKGTDRLDGGFGQDVLIGGSEAYDQDKFFFKLGDSFASSTSSDTIIDWSSRDDSLDMPIAGTRFNYAEGVTTAVSMNGAIYDAKNQIFQNKTYVFLYNPDTKAGYVFADLDHKDGFETGIIITANNGASDMDYLDII